MKIKPENWRNPQAAKSIPAPSGVGAFPQPATGITYWIWEQPHPEGYTAYAITHSREVKPGTGHYDSLESLIRKTGITPVNK